MKKSKFLQNSKDMLSRSFNPAKCKTSLRLAGSRLKLLKNKKEVQVKQMRREIAPLLESGQDRTARIRVEHVFREEKMVAAYDLLEIYCELIVSRLPIIESQKNIPIDLKEAVASLVFASPRCGDVPELLDIRKQFTAKYGKDFTTAAIELRPECGVGRMLVEKLSAVAPDGQTKTKILSAIAEEHNVSWDPKSFDEKDPVPTNDLLSGPSTFGKASTLYAEAPRAGDPDIQAPPPSSDNKIHSTTFNVSQQGPKTLVGTENLSSAQNHGISVASQPETKPPGDKKTQLSQDYESSLDRQRWNMEFKDATTAARAAAESAERASMAARAAAELSNRDRIMRQNSSSEGHVSITEGRENYETSKFASKPFPDDSASKPFLEESEPRREYINRYNEKTSDSFKGHGHGNTKENVQSASLKSKASKDNDTKDQDILAAGAHSQKNPSKVSRGEISMKKQPFTFEAENTEDWSEKSENFREERIGKQSSISFPRSDSKISDDVNIFADSNNRKFGHYSSEDSFVDIGMKESFIKYDSESANVCSETSKHFMEERIVQLPTGNSSRAHSIISDVDNIFVNTKDQTFGHEVDEDPFVGSKGSVPGEASQISTHETAVLVFDKSDSESDGEYDFGTTYDERESAFHLPSKLPENSSMNSDSWSPISGSTKILQPNASSLFSIRKNSSCDLSDNLVANDASEMDNNMAVKFDYSNGPSSESDDDMNMLGRTVKQDSRNISSTQNSSSRSVRSDIKDKRRESFGSPLREKRYSGIGRKQSLSSDDELTSEEIFKERNQGKSDSPGKLSFQKSSAGKKKEYSGFGKRQPSLLSDDELMSEEILERTGQGKSDPPEKSSFRKSSYGKPASRSAESQIESIEYGDESNSDSGEGLNFRKLTGGFRHKGYNQPSYLKNRLGEQSLLKKETQDAATSNLRSISPPAVESPRINKMFGHKKGTKMPALSSDSDSSSEEAEYIQKSSDQRKGRVTPNAAEKVDKKSSLGAFRSNYGSSNYDLDDDAPEESHARKNHLRIGLSRRTKAPSSSAKPNSFPNTPLNESETPDSDAARHRKLKVSDISENQQESESQRNSKELENYERPTSPKVPYKPAKSNFWAPPEQPTSAKAAHGSLHESKMKLKSEALDDDASNDRKPVKIRHKKSLVLDSDEEYEKTSTRINSSETPRKLESERKSTMKWENPERPTSKKEDSKPAKSSVFSPPKQHKVASKPSQPSFMGTPEQPNSSKPTTSTTPEPRTSQTKAETSVSNENLKTATLNKTDSNKGDGSQKASHVHPKLPDYDIFVQAFRKNRP